jgi:hypothetical protein
VYVSVEIHVCELCGVFACVWTRNTIKARNRRTAHPHLEHSIVVQSYCMYVQVCVYTVQPGATEGFCIPLHQGASGAGVRGDGRGHGGGCGAAAASATVKRDFQFFFGENLGMDRLFAKGGERMGKIDKEIRRVHFYPASTRRHLPISESS